MLIKKYLSQVSDSYGLLNQTNVNVYVYTRFDFYACNPFFPQQIAPANHIKEPKF